MQHPVLFLFCLMAIITDLIKLDKLTWFKYDQFYPVKVNLISIMKKNVHNIRNIGKLTIVHAHIKKSQGWLNLMNDISMADIHTKKKS